MAGIPKVKITFDADLEGLKSGVKNATTEVEGFGSKMADFGKKAAAAFAVAAAAAAAYAVKIGIDGVKAAIDDEKAQVKLAGALERATGATKEQIAAVEEQILKTSLATGVADDHQPSILITSLDNNCPTCYTVSTVRRTTCKFKKPNTSLLVTLLGSPRVTHVCVALQMPVCLLTNKRSRQNA